MTDNDTWSPDGEPDTEAFEQGDEALDEATRLDPGLTDALQDDPSLDPTLQVDQRELREIGANLDDPEDEGWELDDAIVGTPATEESE